MRLHLLLLVVAALTASAAAFNGMLPLRSTAFPTPTGAFGAIHRGRGTSSSSSSVLRMSSGPFDAVVKLVKAREACPPQVCLEQLLLNNVRNADLPEAVFHWGHPALMALVVLPLMLGGGYLGWQIRLAGASGDVDGAKRARALHPPLMAAAGLFLVFGVQSGIASLLMQGQPLLDSTHAATAGALLAAFAGQASGALGASMGGSGAARLAHTAAGSTLLALLVAHSALGLALGFQLP